MVVYKTTNIINEKIYIGQTKNVNKKYFGSGLYILRAIKKYGKENFKREIICECSTQEELDEMEQYWIEKFDSKNPSVGYNISNGGSGRESISESTKNKISEHLKAYYKENPSFGEKNPFYGRHHTNETKEKIRASKLGTKLSDEHKRKIGESGIGKIRKNRGVPLSEDHIQKLKDGQARRKSFGLKRKSPPSFSEQHRSKLRESAKRQWIKYKEKNNE